MINVIPLGSRTTIGADAIIKLVSRNKSQLISVAKVVDGEYCSLIAVFSKGGLGEFVAFINEWGTGSGMWFSGWEQVSRVEKEIAAEGVELTEYDLANEGWAAIREVIGDSAKSECSIRERMLAWESIALDMCDNSLPNTILSDVS